MQAPAGGVVHPIPLLDRRFAAAIAYGDPVSAASLLDLDRYGPDAVEQRVGEHFGKKQRRVVAEILWGTGESVFHESSRNRTARHVSGELDLLRRQWHGPKS
jgi:hypothetical protein